ncbi:sulfotransferase domain-containing protein [Leeuwenhoekiella palythoae]|nr:sulfotransferase domain-containing protein [Leeuwenhoekiella palythoae]
MNKIFVHIGYPKSASTTLQKNVFEVHSEILNLGLFGTENIGKDTYNISNSNIYLNDSSLRNFYDTITSSHSIEYSKSNVLEQMQGIFKKYIMDCEGKKKATVFSHELLTSVNFSHPDIGLKATRIKEVFPNAKIIIVIRNQIDFLLSQYRDQPFDPRNFSCGRHVKPDKWIEIALKNDLPLLKSLKYNEVVKLYFELFSKDNVKVLHFEDLILDKHRFATDLSSFMNISLEETIDSLNKEKQNDGTTHYHNVFRRILRKYPIVFNISKNIPKNFLIPIKNTIERKMQRGRKARYSFNEFTIQTLKEYYKSSNVELNDLLDLKDYEY